MGLGKYLNQSLQGGLEKIGYTSSNGPPKNCCKVSNKYLIGHVLGEQNGGSTLCLSFHYSFSFHPPHVHVTYARMATPFSHHVCKILHKEPSSIKPTSLAKPPYA